MQIQKMKSAPWDEYKEQPPERIIVQKIEQPAPPFIATAFKVAVLIGIGFIACWVPSQRAIWQAGKDGYQRGWRDAIAAALKGNTAEEFQKFYNPR